MNSNLRNYKFKVNAISGDKKAPSIIVEVRSDNSSKAEKSALEQASKLSRLNDFINWVFVAQQIYA